MHGQASVFVVVETGAFQVAIVQPESQRLDQMQLGAGIGCQTNDVAGVGRDFRVDENNRDHGNGWAGEADSVRATIQFCTRRGSCAAQRRCELCQ